MTEKSPDFSPDPVLPYTKENVEEALRLFRGLKESCYEEEDKCFLAVNAIDDVNNIIQLLEKFPELSQEDKDSISLSRKVIQVMIDIAEQKVTTP